jgi:hypothetical protein
MQFACAVSSSFISSLSGSTIFFNIFLQTARLSKTKLLNIKCVFWFSIQLLSETFLSIRKIQRGIIIHVHRFSCKVLFVLVRFLWNLNFLNRFSKNTLICNFLKILSMGAELFMWTDGWTGGQAERQTDIQMDRYEEAIGHFSQFLSTRRIKIFKTLYGILLGSSNNTIAIFGPLKPVK